MRGLGEYFWMVGDLNDFRERLLRLLGLDTQNSTQACRVLEGR